MKSASRTAARLLKRPIRAQRNQLVQPPTAATLPPGVTKPVKLTAKNDGRDAVANPHKVMQAQWKKWNGAQRRAFNSLFSFALLNQRLLLHPEAPKIAPEHWHTTAWNMAWAAADSAAGKYWGDEMGTGTLCCVTVEKAKPKKTAPKPVINPKNKNVSTKAKAGRVASKNTAKSTKK